MCKGGSSSSTIDPRILSMLQSNYASAQSVANRPYQPYTGQLTAGLTPSQEQAGSLLQGAPMMGQGAINTGIGAATQGTQYQAPQVSGGAYTANAAAPGLMGAPAQTNPASINTGNLPLLSAPNGIGNIGSYLNPYTQDVANQTLNELNLQNQQQLMNNAQTATADNAFGGTRQGVADALTNEAYQRTAANELANINSQGFNTAAGLLQNNQQMGLNAGGQNLSAMLSALGQNAGFGQGAGLFNAGAQNTASEFNAGNQQQTNLTNAGAANSAQQFDLGQALQAALANQGAAAQAQGLNLQGAGLLGNLGSDQNYNFLAGTNALNAFGTEQQQTQQNALNAQYQQYLNQFNYPVQMQQLLNSSIPFSGAGTSNPSATGQAFGGLLGGAGSFGSALATLLPLL